MAVEIKELVIRAVVSEGEEKEPESGEAKTSAGGDRAAIVAEAVKEVLRILKASKER